MIDFKFEKLDRAAATQLLTSTASAISPIIFSRTETEIEEAALPFYDGYKVFAFSDYARKAPNTRYFLIKADDVIAMNWTNEPIYSVNEKAPIKLDRKTIIPYAKFFFHFVRGQLGRFIIVEKPDEVTWLPNANADEKNAVNAKLMPVTYKGIGRDNLYTLTATVVFKNALFVTDIKVAPYEMDVFDPETNAPEHMTIGQMKLTNEQLLLEDLSVPVEPPPGEFG